MNQQEAVFEELPKPKRGKPSPWEDAAAALKANPGQWARIADKRTRSSASVTARHIKAGVLYSFRPAGTFEAVSRTIDGHFYVYARYVGEESK